jgi:hypothetical protein
MQPISNKEVKNGTKNFPGEKDIVFIGDEDFLPNN